MSFTLPQFTNRIRQHLDDTATSHKTVENLTFLVVGGNGSRKSFILSKQNLVAGATLADVNKAGFVSTGFTVDTANGIISFSTAPPLSTVITNPTSLDVLSYYQEFTDADVQQFIDYGLNKIGVMGSDVSTDYQNVAAPNFNVVCLYGASAGFSSLVSRYAKFVDTSADGKSSSKSKICENYRNQAEDFEKRGDAERLSVQGFRQGRSTVANLRVNTNVPRSANGAPRR